MTASSRQVRNIKYVRNAVTYQSSAYKNCPIHILTCYLSPVGEDAKQARVNIQHLKSMVQNIFSVYKNSRVIVMGDFNSRWIPEIAKFLQTHGLVAAIPAGTATHDHGNQLDQVFTNLPIKFS